MPRNSSGTYSLPAGNPVVTGEVISSTWANTTLSDISTALTGSLDRSGQGAMLAGLQLYDGAVGAPGLTWGTEGTSGLYRAAAGDFRWAQGGSDIWQFSSAGIRSNVALTNGIGGFNAQSAQPAYSWYETDAAADNRLWNITANGEQLRFLVYSDDGATFSDWLTVDRTGTTVDAVVSSAKWSFTTAASADDFPVSFDSGTPGFRLYKTDDTADGRLWRAFVSTAKLTLDIANDAGTVSNSWCEVFRSGTTVTAIGFAATTLQWGGKEIATKLIAVATPGVGTYSTAAGDTNTFQRLGPGVTGINVNAVTAGTVITISNETGGALTLAQNTGTLYWLSGAGRFGPANRTLADGGVVTLVNVDGVAWMLYGAGIT